MNKLNPTDRANVVQCLTDGCSMRATSRITGVARNTVNKLLVELGAACSEHQDRVMRNLTCKRLQVDECRAFCYCKQKHVTPEIAVRQVAGDIWTWAAIDADTKLVPCWCLGKRDAETAAIFVSDMAERLANRVQLTSDGLSVYLSTVVQAFGEEVDYAQLVKIYGNDPEGQKRYSPAHCLGTERVEMMGIPDPAHVSTSYVERQNLTMRMGMRRFTRLPNALSKKAENYAAAVALHMMNYNFSRVHQTLRTTPAMAAEIADHAWLIEEIIALLDSN
jgi:IS1 family transposase